jgi:Zn-dependent M28 family amino/carboxypeptidase
MEGRETGTEGQRKAAAYLQAQFEALGLKAPAGLNGYQQYYPLSKDSITESSLSVQGKTFTLGKEFMASAMTNVNARTKFKQVAFVGYGIADGAYDDYAGLNLNQAIVLVFTGEPKKDGNFIVSGTGKTSNWSGYAGTQRKMQTAKAKGASLVMFVNPTMDTINARQAATAARTGQYFSDPTEPIANGITVSHAMARSLIGAERFQSLLDQAKRNESFQGKTFTQKSKGRFVYQEANEGAKASNVIAVIEGTDKKDEYLVLTAHYDHLGKRGNTIYYGADDDGSGTCGVLEMAEAFMAAKAAGQGPRRTIVFMTVSGEEKGLWGSEYYSNHPVYPLQKTTANLNIDMVGRVDTERKSADTLNYVYVVGHNKLSTELAPINEGMNQRYTQMVLDYKYDDPNDPNRIYYRSDHYNFARKGVPVLFFYDGMLKADYHRPTDTVDKINFELYEKRMRMIFYTAWEMANRDEMVKRDKPLD